MKKYLLILFLQIISLTICAQSDKSFKDFLLPHTTSFDILNDYVGQRIKIAKKYGSGYESDKDIRRFRKFSVYADVDKIYTIEKVKINSKTIVLYLKDEYDNHFKAKINVYYDSSYSSMNYCESFLLVDKVNDYLDGFMKLKDNYKFYNTCGKEIAYVSNVEAEISYQIFTIKTNNNKTFKFYDLKQADEMLKYIDTPILNENRDTVAIIDGLYNQAKKTYWIKNCYTYNSFESTIDIAEEMAKNINLPLMDVTNTKVVAKIKGIVDANKGVYLIEDSCNKSSFRADIQTAQNYCKRVGEIWEHPKLKHSYQVVGILDNKYEIENLTTHDFYFHDCKSTRESFYNSLLDGRYISVLKKVEKPSNSQIRYGKTRTISDDKNITKYSYIGNVIDIIIVGDGEAFTFILKNVSDNSIKIVWNEAVFVNYDGSTSKIMHKGTKYSQREGDQPATTIIKGAKIEDIAVPTCNVRYSYTLEEWVNESMYPSKPCENPGQLRLMLPIQIKDVINEYIFVFDVKYMYENSELVKL